MARAWLYRIATDVCLDIIRRTSRGVAAMHSFAEVPWLQPYADRLLDEIGPTEEEPDAVAVERETIELAFLAAMQVLPPRQRAALCVRRRREPSGARSGAKAGSMGLDFVAQSAVNFAVQTTPERAR